MEVRTKFDALARKLYGRPVHQCTSHELFHVLLQLTKELTDERPVNDGKRKIYYISAEFLIGKLLSNNLINLGVYDEIEGILKESGKSLTEIEEEEREPSLGNGGLGRLAACFMDSIATLQLPGAGIGLNYHYGLFKQVFKDHLQCAEKPDTGTGNRFRRAEPYSAAAPFDCEFRKRKRFLREGNRSRDQRG